MRYSSWARIFLLAAAGTASAFGGVIFSDGGPTLSTLFAADMSENYQIAAGAFTLAPSSNTIDAVEWWGGCSNPATFTAEDCPTGDFTINFYSDASGQPGAEIDTYNVGTANQLLTGNTIVVNSQLQTAEYSYFADIPSLTLTAGVQYWVGFSDSTNETVEWGMEGSGTAPNGLVLFDQPATTWVSENNTLAYSLLGPNVNIQDNAPEPGTFVLVFGALAGLAALKRRG